MRETNDVALVAGISIPLGRFDHNEGNIERAQAERRRLEAEAEADRLARLRRLAALRAEADAAARRADGLMHDRSEEHTSELQSLMRISYPVFCLKNTQTQSC